MDDPTELADPQAPAVKPPAAWRRCDGGRHEAQADGVHRADQGPGLRTRRGRPSSTQRANVVLWSANPRLQAVVAPEQRHRVRGGTGSRAADDLWLRYVAQVA